MRFNEKKIKIKKFKSIILVVFLLVFQLLWFYQIQPVSAYEHIDLAYLDSFEDTITDFNFWDEQEYMEYTDTLAKHGTYSLSENATVEGDSGCAYLNNTNTYPLISGEQFDGISVYVENLVNPELEMSFPLMTAMSEKDSSAYQQVGLYFDGGDTWSFYFYNANSNQTIYSLNVYTGDKWAHLSFTPRFYVPDRNMTFWVDGEYQGCIYNSSTSEYSDYISAFTITGLNYSEYNAVYDDIYFDGYMTNSDEKTIVNLPNISSSGSFVYNAGFELGIEYGWYDYGLNIVSPGYSGNYCGELHYNSRTSLIFDYVSFPIEEIEQFNFYCYPETELAATSFVLTIYFVNDYCNDTMTIQTKPSSYGSWALVDLIDDIEAKVGYGGKNWYLTGFNLHASNTMHFDITYFDDVFIALKPVLELPFDNETANTVYDWSGNGNNGTITGATRTYNGHFGMALDFDGTDYITVPDDDSLDLTSTVALSAWVKPSTVSGSQVIFDKPNAYGLALFNDSIGMMVNGDYYNSSTGIINTDTWYHIVGEYNSTYINIYLDETLIYNTSLSDPIAASAFDLIIGDAYTGIIDECIISTSYSSDLLDPIADYPYVYDGYVDTTACSWILSTLTYNFTNIYIQQNSTYPHTYVMFNFTDGETELGLSYTVSSATFDKMGNEEDVEKLSFITHTATTSNNALTLYARIRIEETILSYADVDLFLYCETATANDSLTIEDRFSIYGIGGVTTTTVVGDGSLIAGGSVFDIMAQNSSETGSGSSIRVDTVTPNFQHVHILTHLYQGASWDSDHWDCPNDDTESGYLEYGVDYMEANCTWVTGWKVRIEIVDGKAGTYGVSNDEAWVRLNVTWYNNDTIIKSDDVYAFYEAYKHDADFNDTTTQFSLYIDLWISSTEFSSNVAGHVSSQYYGMRESGWWLWSNWGPVGTLQTSSTFYDNLYNENGSITSASKLKIFRVWSKIAKVSTGAGSCDDHLWASQNEAVQIKQLPFNIDLVGISSPVFMPTSTPDAPLGFFASMGNILSQALDSIYNAIIGLAQAGMALTASVLDAAFGVIGISNFSTTITGFIGTFVDYFVTSIGYITSLIVDFFTLFANIFTFIIEWFGRIVNMFITIARHFVGILDGTYVATEGVTLAITYLTEFLVKDGALSLISLLLLLSWWDSIDQRAKRLGGGWMGIFMGDINAIISIFSFMMDLSWRVINTVIDLGMRFINMFVPL